MSEKYNPYYSAERLGLNCWAFDEPGLSYEYNTLCFFFTKDGRVYMAQDSGCSCPTPFENCEGVDLEDVLSKLERVGSVAQGLSEYDSFCGYGRGVRHGFTPDGFSRLELEKKLESVFC